MTKRYAIFTKDDELFESGFERDRIAKQVARHYLKSGNYIIREYWAHEEDLKPKYNPHDNPARTT